MLSVPLALTLTFIVTGGEEGIPPIIGGIPQFSFNPESFLIDFKSNSVKGALVLTSFNCVMGLLY